MEVAAVLYFLRNGDKLHFYSVGTIFEKNMWYIQRGDQLSYHIFSCSNSNGIDNFLGSSLIESFLICWIAIFAKTFDLLASPSASFVIRANAMTEKRLVCSIEQINNIDCAIIIGYDTTYDFGDFVISEALNGYPVNKIDNWIFKNCKSLTIIRHNSVNVKTWKSL